MTKELHKAIMKRSRLRNKFLKDRTENNTTVIWTLKELTDNKTFWKTIIPLFTKRPLKGGKINLIENGKNISNDTELCDIFNGFFSNIIFELDIPKKYQCFLNDMD